MANQTAREVCAESKPISPFLFSRKLWNKSAYEECPIFIAEAKKQPPSDFPLPPGRGADPGTYFEDLFDSRSSTRSKSMLVVPWTWREYCRYREAAPGFEQSYAILLPGWFHHQCHCSCPESS